MTSLPSVPTVLFTEPLALDLMNTQLLLPTGPVDLLDDRAIRTEWLTAETERLGISDKDAAAFGDAVAASLKVVRAHAAAAIEPARHGRKPPAWTLSGLNEAIRAAPAAPQARWDGATVVAATHRAGPLGHRLAAGFAEATIELLADPAVGKVRRCAATDCVVLFLPRNPRRRWCSPSICGNRARVARYSQRHKPDPSQFKV